MNEDVRIRDVALAELTRQLDEAEATIERLREALERLITAEEGLQAASAAYNQTAFVKDRGAVKRGLANPHFGDHLRAEREVVAATIEARAALASEPTPAKPFVPFGAVAGFCVDIDGDSWHHDGQTCTKCGFGIIREG